LAQVFLFGSNVPYLLPKLQLTIVEREFDWR